MTDHQHLREAANIEARLVANSLADQADTYRVQSSDDLPLWVLRALISQLESANAARVKAEGERDEAHKVLAKIARSAGEHGERGTTGDGHQQAIQDARALLSRTGAGR